MYRLDSHIHTYHSLDGTGSIQEIARHAVDKGINEIVITDHMIVDSDHSKAWAIDYTRQEQEIRQANERFQGKLKVSWGAEVSYEPQLEQLIQSTISRYAFDQVIGSVHVVNGVDYSNRDQLVRLSWSTNHTTASHPYFQTLLAGVRSGLFDVCGHLDLVKRYGVDVFSQWSLEECWPLIDEVLTTIIQSNMALEINTSGFDQAPCEQFPGAEILERYRKYGGRKVTIGSDCHSPCDVGRYYDQALELVREFDLTVVRFVGRTAVS